MLLPMLAWAARSLWSFQPVEGERLLDIPIPVVSRMKMLLVPFAASVFIGGILWLLNRLPAVSTAFPGLAAVVALSVPMSYHLTTAGIQAGHGQFRRWTEFAGVTRSAQGALMRGTQGTRGYQVYLSGSREDDEFVLTLKNLVRDSYKGKADTEADLRSRRGNRR